jgi:hypothetical protein
MFASVNMLADAVKVKVILESSYGVPVAGARRPDRAKDVGAG